MTHAIHVSGTQVFQQCPRKWWYSSDWGLNYHPVGSNEAITWGNWGHYCLALVSRGVTYGNALLETIARYEEVTPEEQRPENLEAMWDKFSNLMIAHRFWQEEVAGNRYSDEMLEWVFTEQNFELEYQGFKFGGQWDGVVRHKRTGELYVFERKLSARPDTLEHGVQWDLQPRFYTWAAEQLLSEPVAGVLYEVIKRCDPLNVKLLKSGFPSKAQAELAGTTYEVYYKLLVAQAELLGRDTDKVLEDYHPQLEQLRVNNNPVFRRFVLQVPTAHKQQAIQQMVAVGNQMLRLQQQPELIYPNFNRYSCTTFCAFRDVCLTQDYAPEAVAEMLEAEFSQEQIRMDKSL